MLNQVNSARMLPRVMFTYLLCPLCVLCASRPDVDETTGEALPVYKLDQLKVGAWLGGAWMGLGVGGSALG